MPHLYELLFQVFAFVLGAAIGSFLNVCIYRLPLGMSVNEPKRSFCPSCKAQIPWYRNLPLVSWLTLRGKCASCGARISFRYLGVELLTGLLFLAVWVKLMRGPETPWLLAPAYWILVALLVVATFIDFEHFIIPDEITWGGAVAGAALSYLLPPLMGVRDEGMNVNERQAPTQGPQPIDADESQTAGDQPPPITARILPAAEEGQGNDPDDERRIPKRNRREPFIGGPSLRTA